jgi:ATP-dependent helicase/nuclease subunit A
VNALPDAQARERLRTDTASTLFVNAGAGSGKTSSLVDRVCTLVLADGIPLANIATVTFTDKAGAELRDRLREEFERVWRNEEGLRKQAAAEALDDLDGAAIGTLHSFAQRILMEHPIEAGLPPSIDLLDEVGSSVAFEERWSEVQRALLDDNEMAEPILLGLAAGMTFKHVRSLTRMLGGDWDLIPQRALAGPVEQVQVLDLTTFRRLAQDTIDLMPDCTNENDRLLTRMQLLQESTQLVDAAPDTETALGVLKSISAVKIGRIGAKRNWTIDIDEVRFAAAAVVDNARGIVGRVLDQCLRRITRWAAQQVLDAATRRRLDGRLEFHDLLVLARDLLRHHPQARAALHAKYQRLLLDEFQDTDPIQIELAVRIAGGEPADAESWEDVDVPPGRIFVVGDAKQSIYRFRRASIATYLNAQGHLGERQSLRTNFRSVAPVIGWVNDVFGKLIVPVDKGQPDYEPLAPYRPDTGAGPAVIILGSEPHNGKSNAAALRELEAADVAAVVAQALDGGWQAYDERLGAWRPAKHNDIAILVPSRISLPFLEDALDAAGIPYRAEASSLVYQSSEVRDLLACARAIADTSDNLALVTALRSPLFGCGDDDLWNWRRADGRFHLHSTTDSELDTGPVGSALAYLRRLHYDSRWMTPSEILGAIIADRRMLEVAATQPRTRDSWRRLRFVADQARAWSEVSHGGLRAYMAWADHQGQEAARVAESVLPETDANAVRVMTVHAAKGLEFPIVILSGMSAQPYNGYGVRLLWPPDGGYEVRLASGVQTGDFETAVPIDEQMDELEKLRLLYVAATRARDHLVVSLHRSADSKTQTAAKLIADAGGATAAGASKFAGSPVAPAGDRRTDDVVPPPEWEEWLAGLRLARDRSRAIPAISASGLEGTEPEIVLDKDAEPGAAKGPRDLQLPPWSKGRYGSAIGRAVHGVLQVIDLATGAGLDEAVAAPSLAEGVAGQEALVTALVRSALSSEIVQRAAVREHWREMYVGTVRADGTIVEGYIDLIYREDDGTLVIVDYKTDAVTAAGVGSRIAYYAPQMRAYRECLGDATGGDVHTKLLFLHPEATGIVAPVS